MKLYSDEKGHHTIRALGTLIVSRLARVEVPAALWRKHRTEQVEADEIRALVAAFESDYFGEGRRSPRFAVIGLSSRVLNDAARATAHHGLRAYDAIQLASARSVRSSDPDCTHVACFDRTLRDAASVEGFELIP